MLNRNSTGSTIGAIVIAILVGWFATGQTGFAAGLQSEQEPHRNAPEVRKFIAADSSMGIVAVIDEDNQTIWEHKIGPLHDLHVLENGNVLLQFDWTHVVEIEPSTDKIVWEYDSKSADENKDQQVEVHAFQRLEDGNTMIAESGPSRIIEVTRDGKIVATVPLQVANPHPHRDTRLVRRLDSGNYLVCHEGDGAVREYSPDGKVVWDYTVPMFDREPADGHGPESFGNKCFSAIRLENGNTLIGTGNGHSVIEVTPENEIVWKLEPSELPGLELAWITSIQRLPSGNILIGNCHAGPENPQLLEITKDKQVVWQFRDVKRFGNSLTNSQVLSVNGEPVVARPGRDRRP